LNCSVGHFTAVGLLRALYARIVPQVKAETLL